MLNGFNHVEKTTCNQEGSSFAKNFLYQSEVEKAIVDARIEKESLWLTLQQMAANNEAKHQLAFKNHFRRRGIRGAGNCKGSLDSS